MRNKLNEFLFALYLWVFTLMKPILFYFADISYYLLLFVTILVLLISLFYNRLQFRFKFVKSLLLILFILIVLLLDALLRLNSYTLQLIYEFVIYGGIGIYLYSFIEDKKAVLDYFVKISILVFFILIFDPFSNYQFTGTYMIYGFDIALPTFCGIYIGRKFFDYKKLILLEVSTLLLLILFSNKGAILCALIFIIMSSLFLQKISKKQLLRYTILLTTALVLLNNLANIIKILINFLNNQGYFSYSLVTVYNVLNNSTGYALSGRELIWSNATKFISENLLIGSGIGSFQEKYGIYSHNFILDLLIYYGILGLLIFGVIFLIGIYKIFFIHKGYDKIFGLFVLTMWFIPLSTSIYIFKSSYFWVFISIAIIDRLKQRRIPYSKDCL